MKALPRHRQRRDGEHGSCLRCRRGLGVGGGGALPAPAAGGAPALCEIGLYCPTLPHLTRRGSTNISDKGALRTGRRFPTPAEAPGWVQPRLTVPPQPKWGGTGVLRRVLGGRHPAAPPIPAQGRTRQRCLRQPRTCPGTPLSPCKAGRSQRGVQGPPRDASGSLCCGSRYLVLGGGPGDGSAAVWAGRRGLLLFVRGKRVSAGYGRCRRHQHELTEEPGMGWGG